MNYSTVGNFRHAFILGVIALRHARLEARETLRKLFVSDEGVRRAVEDGARDILAGRKPHLIGSTPARRRECQRACYNLAAKTREATEELRVLSRCDETIRNALLEDVRDFRQGKSPTRYTGKNAAGRLAWRGAVETLARKLDRDPLGLEAVERVAMGIEGIKQGTRLDEKRYQALSKKLTPETASLNFQILKKYRGDITPAEAAKLAMADEAEGHYGLPMVVHHTSDGFDHSRDSDPREWAHGQTPEIEAYDAHTAAPVTYQNERQVMLDYAWDDGSPVPGAKEAAGKLIARQKLPDPKHAWLSVEVDGVLEQHRAWLQDSREFAKEHYRLYEPGELLRTALGREKDTSTVVVRKLTPKEKRDIAEAKKKAKALAEARCKQLEQDALDVGVPEDITLGEYQALSEERDLDLKWTALEKNCPAELLSFIKEERRERRNLLAREKRQDAKRLAMPVTMADTILAAL